MRFALLWVALGAVLLGACGGNEPATPIGNDITFDVPAVRGESQTIQLRGVDRGSGTIGVVLAHMLNSSQTAWSPLLGDLADRGFRVLSFDFRGHGLSAGDRDPSLADIDLAGAVAKMRSLGATKIFVIGASMGGTAAIAVAANENLEGVIAISAPSRVGELRVDEAVRRLDEPSLFVVAEKDDATYVDAARAFAGAAPEPKRLEIIRNMAAHGTDLLLDSKAEEPLVTTILDFVTVHGG